MKTCPQCNSKYTDETLQYCLQDGSQLEFGVPETSSMDTAVLGEKEAQTIISARKPEKIRFDLENPDNQTENPRPNPTIETQQQSSNTLLAVLATAVGMFVLFLGIAAAWFYFGSIKDQTAQNQSVNSNGVDQTEANSATPSPSIDTTPEKDPSPGPTPDNTPKIDHEDIPKAVSSQLSGWKSYAEARNLKAYMGKYASKLDYYNKKGASRSFVESDKRKAFTNYTSIKSKFSNIVITASKDGKTATATFDKEWDFSGPDKKATGKVRSQLVFRKIAGEWLIVSERDLKVYYVNK